MIWKFLSKYFGHNFADHTQVGLLVHAGVRKDIAESLSFAQALSFLHIISLRDYQIEAQEKQGKFIPCGDAYKRVLTGNGIPEHIARTFSDRQAGEVILVIDTFVREIHGNTLPVHDRDRESRHHNRLLHRLSERGRRELQGVKDSDRD